MKNISICLGAIIFSIFQPLRAADATINTALEVDLRIHNGAVTLEFDTVSGVIYQIEFSRNLTSWDNEGYAFRGTGGRMSKVVSGRGLDHAFFRIRNDGSAANIAPAGPSREWVSETANRAYNVIYTNTQSHEIDLYIRVGRSNGPDENAARPYVETRKDGDSGWLIVGGTRTSSRFLQQIGDITAVIPAGWQYRLSLNIGPSYTLGVDQWNELK